MKELTKQRLIRWTLYLLLVGMVIIVSYWGMSKISPYIEDFKQYGYPGVFLIALITASTAFVPLPTSIPSLSLLIVVSTWLNPFYVVLLYSLGGALGEGVSYFLGFTGRKILANNSLVYMKVEKWMSRLGMGRAIFFFSIIPPGFFDIIAIISGMLRYPFAKFLLFAFLGRTLRFLAVVFLLAETMKRLFNFS